MEHNLNRSVSYPLDLVAELASRYSIAALAPSLRVCQSALTREELSIAVLGRFKAGKSSFLNHLLGREILPVGVIPVTTVVTAIAWGPMENAEVRFSDGRTEIVGLRDVAAFVTEANNPENAKQVSEVILHLPDLERFKSLRFVDTPGLESAFVHNTGTSLAWAPNSDLALVAVGVDPPLTQQDLSLIRKLFEYTPKVGVLLTKVDLLTPTEAAEVLRFVRGQLSRNLDRPVELFPYSTRPGFEALKADLQEQFIERTLDAFRSRKQAVAAHKLQGLLRECGDYLQLILQSAQNRHNEKQQFHLRALAGRDSLADTKLELQLVARHHAAVARGHIEKILAPQEKEMGDELARALVHAYGPWQMPFAPLLERFAAWLRDALTLRLTSISASHKEAFLQPVRDVQRQYLEILQAFRDRLSGRAMELFGVPLRTTETDIVPPSPKSPDIKIGRVFDHSWELISPIIPMIVIRGAVKARFLDIIRYETFKNLARLTTQWTDIVSETILGMQREAENRLELLIQTVEHLAAPSTSGIPDILPDLDRVQRALQEIQTTKS